MENAADDDPPIGARSFTANELVAYNLAEARRLRGWSLKETAEKLAPFVGAHWTAANVSNVERSMNRGGRRIDVDDLLAFARAFGLPLAWFFIPPAWATEIHAGNQTRKQGERARHPVETEPLDVPSLMTLVLGGGFLPADQGTPWEQVWEENPRASEGGWVNLFRRLDEIPGDAHAIAMRVHAMVVEYYLRAALAEHEEIEKDLLSIADRFSAARVKVADEILEMIDSFRPGASDD